jgi:glycine/D-amino acid oxidase-like deaminating enzyme/nitrite reductase/ring-hydroxylating ferredoxin subunit
MNQQPHDSDSHDSHNHGGSTISSWIATTAPKSRGPLTSDMTTDVCIVGAGIAGLSTAYLVAKQGKRVVVLDDGPIGGGQTCRTTAHLSNAIDDRYTEIERLHGAEGARLAAESHTAAIDTIERIAQQENIDCDFTRLDGYLYLQPGGSNDQLQNELEAAHRARLGEVMWINEGPVDISGGGPCLKFPGQGQFHPTKYLAGLAAAIERLGGQIFTQTHVKSVQGGDSAHVETSDGKRVSAAAIVVATNTPINDMFAIHTKQAPYITYVIGARVPVGSVPKGLFWDTADPYHYVRLQKLEGAAETLGEELLILGGEDHKTGQANDAQQRYARLESWARQCFPQIRSVAFRWSGQVMETVDGLGFIGRNPMDEPNVFIATGDSGMGMTHGTIAGLLLTDLIVGRDNPWAGLYDPSRKRLGAGLEFTKENLNVAAQYTSWLTRSEVSSVDQLQPGQGAVIRHGLKKIAAYRDEQGALHECSATCPHMMCVVSWNSNEKTWDCPCHGSRFDCHGHVINGPANVDLEPIGQHIEAHS